MARKAIVTRTIIGTQVSVMALDTESGKVNTLTYVLSGKIEDSAKALKAVQKTYDTETLKHAKVLELSPLNKLMGMWEEDFIANAFELDPQTRKALTAEQTDSYVEAG